MISFLIITFCTSGVFGYAPLREPGAGLYNDVSFIQDVLERMNRNLELDRGNSFAEIGNRMGEMSPMRESAFDRTAKDSEFLDGLDYDTIFSAANIPFDKSLINRDTEYLKHSTLTGQSSISGEGSQKINGGQKAAEMKTDAILPAYCNPPNPCPVGFTAEDGCLETFENTAAFSRSYQASQDCMCDTEHMFECPAPRDNDMDSNDFLINDLQQVTEEHKSLVAKKFYNKKASHDDDESARMNSIVAAAAAHSMPEKKNPYLQGEKLRIAAKKGHNGHHAHDNSQQV